MRWSWRFGSILVAAVLLVGCAGTRRELRLSNEQLQAEVGLVKQRVEADSLVVARIDALESETNLSLNGQRKQLERLGERETNLEAQVTILGDRVDNLERGMKKPVVAEVPAPVIRFGAGEPKSGTAQYEAALKDYYARKYRDAIGEFSQFIGLNPGSDLSDNAQYWISECYYGLKNYRQALAEFQKVFLYPKTNKADDAQIKIGYCYMELGEKTRAMAEFEKLIAQYPNSEYVKMARSAMLKLQTR